MRKITINPVTRIEGHAKIDIYLDDKGIVADTQLHVTQVRGFEKFVEGRPFYEMPSITARICGICPISHLLASAKACDAIMAVTPPEAGVRLRELVHCAQMAQSHALSFFYLSAPDLLLGFDSDPALRNVLGLIDADPQTARGGSGAAQIRAGRHRGLGTGADTPVVDRRRRRQRAAHRGGARPHPGRPARARALAGRTLEQFEGLLDRFAEEIAPLRLPPRLCMPA